MNAHEIFATLTPETIDGVFDHLYKNDKPAYRACMDVLAQRRKLRVVLIERKSRSERAVWMGAELARRANEDAAVEVLQAWLLGAHREMVCGFLDDLGVAHDGNGLLEDLPPEPAHDRIEAAVDGLFSAHPPGAVAAYLRLFVGMDIADWPVLKEIVATDARMNPVPV